MKMKRLYGFCAGLCLLAAATACNNDDEMEKYDTPDCRLNFLYYNSDSTLVDAGDVTDQMRLYPFSFVLSCAADAERDTLWFDVETMGFLSDEPRPVALRQIVVEGVKNAEPGKHYVAFDDPEVASLYRVAAKQSRTKIPVIVLRQDAALQDTTVVLKFGFRDNGYFLPGYEGLNVRTMEITDRLARPENWYTPLAYGGYYNLKALIGPYGEMKHRLMIEWTDKKWDADYIEEILTGDAAYLTYLRNWFPKKLAEKNAIRQEAGEEVYKEKDGTPVEFVTTWDND